MRSRLSHYQPAGFVLTAALVLSQTVAQTAALAQSQEQTKVQQSQGQAASASVVQPGQAAQAQSAAQNSDNSQAQSQEQTKVPVITVTPAQTSDDGQNVPANGTIDGTDVKQFLNSGPQINATQMEEASIPADNLMQMPNSVPNGKKKKPKKGLLGAISRGWINTCNAIGFPVGGNDDIGIDASLSSDLPQAVRDRDGAYNPNK